MCWLGKSIYNHPNGIVVDLSTRKIEKEVHGYVFLLPFRDRQRLKGSKRFLMFCLHLLAHKTLGHIFSYISFHTRPPIIFFDSLIHFGTTRMHSICWTMWFFHDRYSQIINIKYTYSAIHGQNSILSNSKILSNITIHNLIHFFEQLIILYLFALDLINQCWLEHHIHHNPD